MQKNLFIIIPVAFIILFSGTIWAFSQKTAPASEPPTTANESIDTSPSNASIRITTPKTGGIVSSPLLVKGEARGTWFFEASFPISLVDWDGKIIGQGIAQAQGDWMTTDFVPFEATITFTADANAYKNTGTLILQKDNPSGLPKNDDSFEIPVIIK